MVDTVMDHVDASVNYVKNAINEGDYSVIGILVGCLVGLITLFVLGCLKSRGNKRRGVLLLGSCDAGKTLLFSQLIYGKHKSTFTSMSANSGIYSITENGKTLRVIDLPGHERVRLQMLDTYKDLTRAIIFVVDSSSIQKDIKDIAEYLYTVLSDGKISSICPPILIACNKQDLTFAKGAKVVQAQLEKEMNTLRVTKSAALQDTSSGNNNMYLGKRDRNFTFADMKPLKIEFVECSALGSSVKGSDPELDDVQQWLTKIA